MPQCDSLSLSLDSLDSRERERERERELAGSSRESGSVVSVVVLMAGGDEEALCVERARDAEFVVEGGVREVGDEDGARGVRGEERLDRGAVVELELELFGRALAEGTRVLERVVEHAAVLLHHEPRATARGTVQPRRVRDLALGALLAGDYRSRRCRTTRVGVGRGWGRRREPFRDEARGHLVGGVVEGALREERLVQERVQSSARLRAEILAPLPLPAPVFFLREERRFPLHKRRA